MLLPAYAFSQATTEQEYNYMKKGFRDVEERGLDVKSGYYVEELKGSPVIEYTYTALWRTKDSSLAGIIVKTTYGNPKYYCIPAVSYTDNKSFGWNLFFKDVDTMGLAEAAAVNKFLAWRLASEMAHKKKR